MLAAAAETAAALRHGLRYIASVREKKICRVIDKAKADIGLDPAGSLGQVLHGYFAWAPTAAGRV